MTYSYDEVALECEFAQCRTFGSVIRYALDLEMTAAAFYDDAKNKGLVKDAVADLFEKLATEHKKRKDLLEHTRREKLNEMILEPIDNIDSAMFKPELKKFSELDAKGAIAQALELEDKSNQFYAEASKEAKSLLAEAARILVKMGKDNSENASKLKALQ